MYKACANLDQTRPPRLHDVDEATKGDREHVSS